MTQVTDAGIQSLQEFPALESLSYGSYVVKKLTGQSIQHVSKIGRLSKLNVGMFPISDAELGGLVKLTNLTELRIGACQISDEGLSFLPALTQLRSLTLSGNGPKLTNKCLDIVTKLTDLEELRISDQRKINDDGLKQIGELSKLRKLDLNGTLITDATMVHLNNLPLLQELQVGGTGITDAGLVHVLNLSELQMLNVSGTRITQVGLDSLQALKQLNRIVK